MPWKTLSLVKVPPAPGRGRAGSSSISPPTVPDGRHLPHHRLQVDPTVSSWRQGRLAGPFAPSPVLAPAAAGALAQSHQALAAAARTLGSQENSPPIATGA